MILTKMLCSFACCSEGKRTGVIEASFFVSLQLCYVLWTY